jgi:hypothetical protein
LRKGWVKKEWAGGVFTLKGHAGHEEVLMVALVLHSIYQRVTRGEGIGK